MSNPPESPAVQVASASEPSASSTLKRTARIAEAWAVTGALIALISGPGNRMGWWDYRRAFAILGWAAGGGLIAAILSLSVIGWAMKRQVWRPQIVAAIGLLVGLFTFALPFPLQWRSNGAPPIHDITTDPAEPPEFRVLVAARTGVPNGVAYGGPAVAAAQQKAYPDITPLTLAAQPEVALHQCLQVAHAMGWDVAEGSVSPLGFEATDTTLFFGFRDDIIVRLAPVGAAGKATRIDVRSVSRVGRSDRGVNARRIRDFFRLLSRSPIKAQ